LAWIVVFIADMHRLDPSVEASKTEASRPPFCPRETCPSNRQDATSVKFYSHASYTRLCDGKRVRRFVCCSCGKSFSEQTFSCTYYLKRPELLEPIAAGLNAGSAHRQLARSLRCAPSTVTGQAARLGRHALLFHAQALERLENIDEPIVYDDFESFAYSQDHPFGIGTTVGKSSWFIYGLECAPHRRGGKPTLKSRVPGPEHCRPGMYRKAFERMLDLLVPKTESERALDVITDGHPGYRAGWKGHSLRARVRHTTFPNPIRGPKGSKRSPQAVRRDRAMFVVDTLHKLIRHTAAHHRRETIAFGRRVNALMERAFLLVVWRNYVKARTERRPDTTTPAMAVGLTNEPWSWGRVLAQRLFPWRCRVPESWRKIYCRELTTPAVGRNQRHRLVNAF
jgi:transposase-like protein